MVNIIAISLICLLSLLAIRGYSQNMTAKIKASPGQAVSIEQTLNDGKINADFPEPTDLRDIARAFSLWTGTDYIVDDTVQIKVKLNSPERIPITEALKRFRRMLNLSNLETVENDGGYRIMWAQNQEN